MIKKKFYTKHNITAQQFVVLLEAVKGGKKAWLDNILKELKKLKFVIKKEGVEFKGLEFNKVDLHDFASQAVKFKPKK